MPENPKGKEMEILYKFIASTNFGMNLPKGHCIWRNAFLSRHWGLKLRMIDWTIDLSAALYFMFQNADIQNTSALFILPKKAIHFTNEIPNCSNFLMITWIIFIESAKMLTSTYRPAQKICLWN